MDTVKPEQKIDTPAVTRRALAAVSAGLLVLAASTAEQRTTADNIAPSTAEQTDDSAVPVQVPMEGEIQPPPSPGSFEARTNEYSK